MHHLHMESMESHILSAPSGQRPGDSAGQYLAQVVGRQLVFRDLIGGEAGRLALKWYIFILFMFDPF